MFNVSRKVNISNDGSGSVCVSGNNFSLPANIVSKIKDCDNYYFTVTPFDGERRGTTSPPIPIKLKKQKQGLLKITIILHVYNIIIS